MGSYVCKLPRSSLGHWEGIYLFIIKYKISIFPIVVNFFHGCVSEVGFHFYYLCAVYDVCKKSATLWPEAHIHLFGHTTDIIVIMYTYLKALNI